jgi:hypothetical protein
LYNGYWEGIVEGYNFKMYKEASAYDNYAKQRNNTSPLQSAEEE